jgi:putative ABC transport system permease protein
MRRVMSLAWREGRGSRRRLLLYMSAVSLGVAALVALDSFSENVRASVHESSRTLLGGDFALSSRAPLRGAAALLVDSLAQHRARLGRLTTFPSMASVHRTGRTRLAQVRAVSTTYPLVGQVVTDPVSAWPELAAGSRAVVDPSLLATLGAHLGDTLTLGFARFIIAGTLHSVPGDAGIAAAIGPRVFIAERDLTATRLLVFGSRADYRTLIALPPGSPAVTAGWIRRIRPRLDPLHVRVQTSADAEANLTDSIDRLTNFLGVIGIVALLLGGIGVASGVTAFVAAKIDTTAILRCLGGTGPQVLTIAIAQAAAMGLVGAAFGAALGVGMQFGLPHVLADFLPIDLAAGLVPRAIVLGLALGLWVSVLFALRPLLGLRRVSPLQALRRDTNGGSGRAARWTDPALLVTTALIVATIGAIAIGRAPSRRVGWGTTGGIAAVLVLLWLTAILVTRGAHTLIRAHWPYVVRQGVANLYRPFNQTRAVVLALGFGAFLISTISLVQSALLRELTSTAQGSRANLLFFDVQQDQMRGVDSAVSRAGYHIVEQTPIVTMRIAAIDGASVAVRPPGSDTLSSDDPGAGEARRRGGGENESRAPRRAQWALRREYRSTYRDSLVSSERLATGRWTGSATASDSLAGISVEDGLARELGIAIGSTITWDVQGVPVRTRVTSLRSVDWARFEPNFFVVFPRGVLESAPQQFVILTDVPSSAARANLQRVVVDAFPNVSTVDLSLIQQTVNGILAKVRFAVRFLSLFALAMGIPVLVSAVAASRRERVREGVLLKTLGATRGQVGRIMAIEYATLGVLGSAAGIILSFAGAWGVLHFVFDMPFVPAPLAALLIAALTALCTVAIGMLGSREVFSAPVLPMLRAE